MTDHIIVERDGPLEVLTLNDPNRANPLSRGVVDELTLALDAAATSDELRAVILTGAGAHFSAGADLTAMQEIAAGGDEAANLRESQRFERLFATLLDHPLLTVAAVHGAAVAGGCGLATACDLVVAEPSARFSYTEVKIGYVPALVSTFLGRRVPGHVLRRLLLDPEMIDGKRAVAIGLADELANEGEALSHARELALRVVRKASPAALAATKKLMSDTIGVSWREALSHASRINALHRDDPECRRGVRHFLETKTTPDWLDEK